jgi:tetratricopeptide (TPR) repeat protein
VELYYDGAQLLSRQCTGDPTAYANCLNNLAAVLFEMGMEEPSAHLFGQLLAVKQSLGHDTDGYYADNLYNLANAVPASYTQAAEEMHKKAYEMRVLTEATQDIVDSLHSMAFLFEERGEYANAFSFAKEALSLAEGDNYICSVFYLAELYDDCGKYNLALPLYEEAAELTRERLGITHPCYIEALTSHAKILEKLNYPYEALEKQIKLRAILETLPPQYRGNAYTACLRSIAELHLTLDEYEQAEQTLMYLLKLHVKQKNDYLPEISLLIRLYLHMNNQEKAMEILVYALMHSDTKGSGLTDLLTQLATAFHPSSDPSSALIITTLHAMNNRETLKPIINKWTAWENELFIPAFVMPVPAGRDRK